MRLPSRFRLLLVVALFLPFAAARAQFIWIGAGNDNSISNPANWSGGTPTGNGTEDLVFQDANRGFISYTGSFAAHNVTHDAESTGFFLGDGGTDFLLYGDATSNGGSGGFFVFSASTLTLSTGVTHNFDVSGAPIYVFGALSGSGDLNKIGGGDLIINSGDDVSNYTGAITVGNGTLSVAGNGSLGTGTLTMDGGTLYVNKSYAPSGNVTLYNNLIFTANTAYFGENPSDNHGASHLTFTGGASTTSGTSDMTVNVAPNALVEIQGDLAPTDFGVSLTVSGGGTLILAGTNNSWGETFVDESVLILGNAPGPLNVSSNGYLGTYRLSNLQSGFLDRFNPSSTFGTVGVDSPDVNNPQEFTADINLSQFGSEVRFGTSTAAIVSGLITPNASHHYLFGGTGVLTITSGLADVAGQSNVTAREGLKLYLQGTNTYTGITYADNGGAIIFDAATALPASSLLENTSSGYIGYTENTGLLVDDFLRQWDHLNTYGVIGFDSADPLNPVTISEDIDLSSFADTGTFLGTATAATLSGTITPNGTYYRFTGFRDGQLTVTSTLTDIDAMNPRSVLIGLERSSVFSAIGPGNFYQPSVTLTGDNTYTGGTTLQSGLLIFGSATAIGTGTLTITAFNPAPTGLRSAVDNLDIANPITIYSEGVDLLTLGGSHPFTLSGNITGGQSDGSIYKGDNNTITLSGDNSNLQMGFSVYDGHLVFASDHAAGTGEIALMNTDFGGGQVAFTSENAQMGTLSGQGQTALQLLMSSTGALTVNQADTRNFDGVISGTGGFIKDGGASLTLTKSNTYTGDTEVRNGSLFFIGGGLANSANLTVGVSGSDDGYLSLQSGAVVNASTATLSNGADTSGVADISGGSTQLNVSGNLVVGGQGYGALNLDQAATVNSSYGFVGTSGSGDTSVADGSHWNVANELIVGAFTSDGYGTMTVASGGVVTADLGSIGYVGTGHVYLVGSGSQWNNAGRLWVGSGAGQGYLSISGGASATSSSGEVGIDSASGTALLNGVGSMWSITNGLIVGKNFGSGIFDVENGATLSVGSGLGTITLGFDSGSDGTLNIGQLEFGSANPIINAAEITGGGGSGFVELETAATKALPYYLTNTGTSGGTAILLSGSLHFENRQGYNVISGSNTFTGTVTLSGGTLVAASNNALGTGMIVFNGGALSVGNGVTLSNSIDLSSGGTLNGNGTFTQPIDVGANVVLAPGNSVGLLTFTGGLTWSAGGSFDLEVQSAYGNRGTTGYDAIDVTGGLLQTATAGNEFTLRLISLDAGGNAGLVSDFSSSSGYAWLIAHTDGLSGFNPAGIIIDTSNFQNPLGVGAFNVSAVGNDVYLNFSPVPEPSTYALLAAGLVTAFVPFARRRRC